MLIIEYYGIENIQNTNIRVLGDKKVNPKLLRTLIYNKKKLLIKEKNNKFYLSLINIVTTYNINVVFLNIKLNMKDFMMDSIIV